VKALIGQLGLALLLSAFLAGAAIAGDACGSVDCAKEKNGTDDYAACCVPKSGDLGQTVDSSCSFKATLGSKSDAATGPIALPEGVTPPQTSGQGK
jgi:hypothetical protein